MEKVFLVQKMESDDATYAFPVLLYVCTDEETAIKFKEIEESKHKESIYIEEVSTNTFLD